MSVSNYIQVLVYPILMMFLSIKMLFGILFYMPEGLTFFFTRLMPLFSYIISHFYAYKLMKNERFLSRK